MIFPGSFQECFSRRAAMDKFKVAKETMSGCRRSFWRTYGSTTVGLLCVAAAIGVAGCDQASHTTEQEKKAIEVIVTTPITDEVTDYQDFTGRLDALKTVDIRARVSGFVMTAPFKDRKSTRLNSSQRCISYAVF